MCAMDTVNWLDKLLGKTSNGQDGTRVKKKNIMYVEKMFGIN